MDSDESPVKERIERFEYVLEQVDKTIASARAAYESATVQVKKRLQDGDYEEDNIGDLVHKELQEAAKIHLNQKGKELDEEFEERLTEFYPGISKEEIEQHWKRYGENFPDQLNTLAEESVAKLERQLRPNAGEYLEQEDTKHLIRHGDQEHLDDKVSEYIHHDKIRLQDATKFYRVAKRSKSAEQALKALPEYAIADSAEEEYDLTPEAKKSRIPKNL